MFVDFSDDGSRDAFGNGRFSQQYTVFSSSEIYQQENLYWSTSLNGSGSAITQDTGYADVTLTTGTASGNWASYQTKTYWNYQPGKSQLIKLTGNFFGGVANAVKRIGLFDDNNGFYFQLSGTALSVGLRTHTSGSTVDTIVPQTSWNVDKMDGTGVSHINLDTTKAQIWVIDYQWLGVGRVRYGVGVRGQIYYVHMIDNSNAVQYPYVQSPNLPVRYEQRNVGTLSAATMMTKICAAVASEGGVDGGVYRRSVSIPVAATVGNTPMPIVAIRIQAGYTRGAAVRPTSFWAVNTGTNSATQFGVCYNCGLVGGTWVKLTNSAVEYNTTATAIYLTFTTSAIVSTNGLGKNASSPLYPITMDRFLWGSFDYNQVVPDTWTLYGIDSSGSDGYLAGFNFDEVR